MSDSPNIQSIIAHMRKAAEKQRAASIYSSLQPLMAKPVLTEQERDTLKQLRDALAKIMKKG